MLSYSNFKTLLLQLVAEKDQEKHQPVKNVDSQERATRKASVPPLQYQWRTSNLISLDLVICKGTLTSMCTIHYSLGPLHLQSPCFVTCRFNVFYIREPCILCCMQSNILIQRVFKAKHLLQVLIYWGTEFFYQLPKTYELVQ